MIITIIKDREEEKASDHRVVHVFEYWLASRLFGCQLVELGLFLVVGKQAESKGR